MKNRSSKKFLLSFILSASLGACANIPSKTAVTPDPRPALLASLDGEWSMTGDVRGKPVVYRLVAKPVLGSRFTELHMIDVQVPPQYEARVFIGYDQDSQQVFTHWLDSYGAKYSVPHGTGTISGNTIEFQIPYASGPFRDTLTFDPQKGTWLLEIAASKGAGNWTHFARYEIKK